MRSFILSAVSSPPQSSCHPTLLFFPLSSFSSPLYSEHFISPCHLFFFIWIFPLVWGVILSIKPRSQIVWLCLPSSQAGWIWAFHSCLILPRCLFHTVSFLYQSSSSPFAFSPVLSLFSLSLHIILLSTVFSVSTLIFLSKPVISSLFCSC